MEQYKTNGVITNGNILNYYVSKTGSDENDGLSVSSPFATIRHAIDVAVTTPMKYDVNVVLLSDIVEDTELIRDTDHPNIILERRGIVINEVGRKITIKSDSTDTRRKVAVATKINEFTYDSSTRTLSFVIGTNPMSGIMVNGNIIPLTVDDKDAIRKPYGMKMYNINSWDAETKILKFTTSDEMPANLTTDSFFQFIYEFKCCISRFASLDNGVYTTADPITEPRAYGGSRFRIFNCPDYLEDNTYYYTSNGDNTYTVVCKLDSSVSSIGDVFVFDSKNVFSIENSFGVTIKDIEVYGNIGHSFGYLTDQAGLVFVDWTSHDYYNGVLISNSSNITITNTFFSQTYDYAIRVDNSCNIFINGNRLYDLNGGGIDITHESYNVYVESNIVNGYGRFGVDFAGILLRRVHHCTVIHNTVCDGFYTAINVGWSFNYDEHTDSFLRVAYNDIHHIGQFVGADGGGIYMLGKLNDSYIEYNKVHDVFTWYQNNNVSMTMSGIYTDSGTALVIIRYNLVYCCDYFNHATANYQVEFFNNIFAYPRKNEAIKFNNGYKYEKTSMFYHNIFLTDKPLLWKNSTENTVFHRNFITGISDAGFEEVIDDNNVFGNNPFTSSSTADFSFAVTEDRGFQFGRDERYNSLDFDTLRFSDLGFIDGGYGCLVPEMEPFLALPDIDGVSYDEYYRSIADGQGIEYAFIG